MAVPGWRLDCTQARLYSLSPASRDLLERLPAKAELDFYFSRDYPELTHPMVVFAQRLEYLLHQIENASDSIGVKVVAPSGEAEEEAIEKMGVVPNIGSMGDSWYSSLVIRSGERVVCMNGLAPESEASLEYDIMRALLNVASGSRKKVGIMTGLPLFGQTNVKTRTQSPPWRFIEEMKTRFDIVKIPVTGDVAPDGLDALVVVYPSGLPEKTEYLIGQYVVKGGNLVVFCDSVCRAATVSANRFAPMIPGFLKRLFAEWNIVFSASEVVADSRLATPMVSSQDGLQVQPTLLNVNGEFIDRECPFTSSLDSVKMFCPGTFSWTEETKRNLRIVTLLESSPQSAMLKSFEAQRPAAEIMADFKEDGISRPLAILAEGRFSCRIETYIQDENRMDEGEGRVLLVGDVDMLHDSLCYERTDEKAGEKETEHKLSDNIEFLLNALEFLTGDVNLAQIRAKTGFQRPLNAIQDMADETQRNVQKILTDAHAEELKVAEQLRLLEQTEKDAKDGAERTAATEEIGRLEAKLDGIQADKFRNQRSELKRLRLKLDAVERKMLLMNLVPVFLAIAAGCLVAWRRR